MLINSFTRIFEEKTILNDNQYGFRNGRGTCQAILRHMKYIYEGINEGSVVFPMYLDFKKNIRFSGSRNTFREVVSLRF